MATTYTDQNLKFGGIDLADDVNFLIGEYLKANLNTAIPAYVKTFNAETQRATVQCSIKLRTRVNTGDEVVYEDVKWPLLLDVPVQFPHAGGYCITFPVATGDEGLLFFCQRAIATWKTYGSIQSQSRPRHFDKQDGMLLLGFNSEANSITSFSEEDMQIRNSDATQVISLTSDGQINIQTTSTVNIQADKGITIDGDLEVTGAITADSTITASGEVTGNGIALSTHVHGGVTSGSATTSTPE